MMHNRRGRIGLLLAATALLLLISSCTSKKKLVSPMAHAADYEWMTAKMTMDITAPNIEFNNVTGSLRMRRDSTVWISAAAMMGIESIRALITQDSVILINRLEQSYLAEPLSEVASALRLPATLQESQSMLLGNGTTDHVEIQFGPYMAKIQYSDIHWDEPTTFPIKINKRYERMKLQP